MVLVFLHRCGFSAGFFLFLALSFAFSPSLLPPIGLAEIIPCIIGICNMNNSAEQCLNHEEYNQDETLIMFSEDDVKEI